MERAIFYLLMASIGEYSDREQWPIALYETEEDAQHAADRSTAWARERTVVYDIWRREVFMPWHVAAHPNLHGKPFINPEPPPRPPDPVIPPNPDDPEHIGDTYWVEPVPLRSAR